MIFNIRMFNLDEGLYLSMIPEKALAKVEKDINNLYLQACLERRCFFTPMVYSADVIPRAVTLAAHK